MSSLLFIAGVVYYGIAVAVVAFRLLLQSYVCLAAAFFRCFASFLSTFFLSRVHGKLFYGKSHVARC